MSSARSKLRPTQKHCEEWLQNKTLNPKTGKAIAEGGPTYLAYEAAANAFGLTAAQSQQRPQLPKKVGHIKMPQTKKEWVSNDFTGKYFHNILFMFETLAVLTENDYNVFSTYSKICSLGLEFDIVPNHQIVIEQQRKFDQYINIRPDVNIISIRDQEAYNLVVERAKKFYPINSPKFNEYVRATIDELHNAILKVLINGYSERIEEKFTQMSAFIRLTIYERLIDQSSISEKNIEQALEELDEFNTVRSSLDRIIATNEAYVNKLRAKSMSVKTRSPKFPSNMESREIVRNRIRLQPTLVPQVRTDSRGNKYTVHRPDPNEPPRFVDKVNINELKATDRSHFKSYEELEHMSPLTDEVLIALPEKKRTELLYELKAACNEMKDTVTNARFDRMRKKQLHLIVRLGNPQKKQRCYYVRTAYKMWNNAVKNNKAFENPETRVKVTEEEKADIMNKIQYVKQNVVNPEGDTNIIKDPELKIEIKQTHNKLFNVRVVRPFGKSVYSLINLGYIPADIEVEHSGSADITSAVAVFKIKQLFEKGRLMRSNFIPYQCCNIHLPKEIEYWNEPMPERVKKLTKILDEINEIL